MTGMRIGFIVGNEQFIDIFKKVKDKYFDDMKKVGKVEFNMSWRKQKAEFYTLEMNGVKYYFVENDYYFYIIMRKLSKLLIVNNTIDGISALIVNRLLRKQYTNVIVLNQGTYSFKCLNSYESITCVDVIPFNEDKLKELLNSSKKIHIFIQNVPDWISKYTRKKNIHIYSEQSSSLSYYNSLCYDLPILKNYLERIHDRRYKSIFTRKYYRNYINTIVHELLPKII